MSDKTNGRSSSLNRYSPYCDFIYYESSRTPGLMLGMRVLKPGERSYILAGTHGWHMDAPEFEFMDTPASKYLSLQVDMRGRAYSDGKPDCNGWELYDVIDAVNFARKYYSEYIIDKETVYFEGESGGGGNAYSIIGKFPDFFAAATIQCGISDYEMWYRNDAVGEFRDEMDLWVRYTRMKQHGISGQEWTDPFGKSANPSFIAHGEIDPRVPVEQARKYIRRAGELGKDSLVNYMEFKGVGHWDNVTNEQEGLYQQLSERNRALHRRACEDPGERHDGCSRLPGYPEAFPLCLIP